MDTIEENAATAALTLANARAIDANTILGLYEGNLLGFKEARSLVESIFEEFKAIRDFDLDNEATKEVTDV